MRMLHISIKTPPAPSKSPLGLLYYAGGPFYTNAPGEKERGKRREKGKERRKKEKTKRKEKRREEQKRNGPFLKPIAYFTEGVVSDAWMCNSGGSQDFGCILIQVPVRNTET